MVSKVESFGTSSSKTWNKIPWRNKRKKYLVVAVQMEEPSSPLSPLIVSVMRFALRHFAVQNHWWWLAKDLPDFLRELNQ